MITESILKKITLLGFRERVLIKSKIVRIANSGYVLLLNIHYSKQAICIIKFDMYIHMCIHFL